MSNKNVTSKATFDSAHNDLQKSENNSSSITNSRYSLGGGARSSLGAVKAGRLSQAHNKSNGEFADSGKVSLGGRNSLSANDSRASLSRYFILLSLFIYLPLYYLDDQVHMEGKVLGGHLKQIPLEKILVPFVKNLSN